MYKLEKSVSSCVRGCYLGKNGEGENVKEKGKKRKNKRNLITGVKNAEGANFQQKGRIRSKY
jgi:hypothetical protein